MIVVTGATGNVGRRLVDLLVEADQTVTAVSRGTTPPPSRVGVIPHLADVSDLNALAPAMKDAEALFLLVSGAGAHVDGPALFSAAADAGVARLVLLSSQLAGTRPDSPSHAAMARLEAAVRGAGPSWTILRPSGFMTNDLSWATTIPDRRTVFTPYADVALPVIDPADIAAVAAATLVEDGHGAATYTLTGPAAISPRDRVSTLRDALGIDIELVELTREAAKAQMTTVMPEQIADGALDVLGHPSPKETMISPDVARVLARTATTYAAWVTRSLAKFQ